MAFVITSLLIDNKRTNDRQHHLNLIDSLIVVLENERILNSVYRQKSMFDELYIEGNRDSALILYKSLMQFEDFDEVYYRRLHNDSLHRTMDRVQIDHINRLSQNFLSVSKMKQHLDTVLASSNRELEYLGQWRCNMTDSVALLLALMEEMRVEQAHMLDIIEIDKGENQVVYIGKRKEGKAHGYGVGYWSSGSLYKGDWRANERHGHGWYKWKDGDIYEGDFKNDKRTGTGVYTWKDGEHYRGGWKENMREGYGAIYYPNGKLKYEGTWKNDKFIPLSGKDIVESSEDSLKNSN